MGAKSVMMMRGFGESEIGDSKWWRMDWTTGEWSDICIMSRVDVSVGEIKGVVGWAREQGVLSKEWKLVSEGDGLMWRGSLFYFSTAGPMNELN